MHGPSEFGGIQTLTDVANAIADITRGVRHREGCSAILTVMDEQLSHGRCKARRPHARGEVDRYALCIMPAATSRQPAAPGSQRRGEHQAKKTCARCSTAIC